MHWAPIMGGMWGMKTFLDRKIANHFFLVSVDYKISLKYNPQFKNLKGKDQEFLANYVYKSIVSNSFVHDSYLCKSFVFANPWPSIREGNCFVGSPDICQRNLSNFYKCPFKCRPKSHSDWEFC